MNEIQLLEGFHRLQLSKGYQSESYEYLSEAL